MSEKEATEEEVAETPQYSEAEQKAMQVGWSPDKENLPEGKEFLTAEEYLAKGKFIGKIIELERNNKKLERKLGEYDLTINDLKEHNRQIKQFEYQRALADLERKKVEALDSGEHEEVVKIDKQIQAAHQQQATQPAQQPADPDWLDWLDRNDWYEKNEVMQAAAKVVAARINQSHAHLSSKRRLEMIEEEVRKEFPHKFATEQQVVEGAHRVTTRKTGLRESDLSPEDRVIMNRMVRVAKMTKEEFLKDLEKLRS